MTWSPDGKTVVVSSRRDIMTWIDVNSQQVIKKWDVGREVSESFVCRQCSEPSIEQRCLYVPRPTSPSFRTMGGYCSWQLTVTLT